MVVMHNLNSTMFRWKAGCSCLILIVLLACDPASAINLDYAKDPAISFASINILQTRLKEMLVTRDDQLVESCNDWFYALSCIDAPAIERKRAFMLVFDNRKFPVYSEWRQLRTDYLLRNLKIDSLDALELIKASTKIGLLELSHFELTELVDEVVAAQLASTQANVLKIEILTALSSRWGYEPKLRRKWSLEALKIGISDKSINDALLSAAFDSFLASYGFPNAPQSYYDSQLPLLLRALAADATKNRKHEFISNCSFDELRKCGTAEQLITTMKLLTDKLEAAGVSPKQLMILYAELGITFMLDQKYGDAILPLKRAAAINQTLPDQIEYRFLLVLSIAECYRKQEGFREASAALHSLPPNEKTIEFACLEAHWKTAEALLLRQRRDTHKAILMFKELSQWYADHPDQAEEGPYGFRYLASILPGELDVLDNMAEIEWNFKSYEQAKKIKSEKEKVLQLRKQNSDELAQRADEWVKIHELRMPDEEKVLIISWSFNTEDCSKLAESLHGRQLPENRLPRKFELLDYAHSLIAKKNYRLAQKIALTVAQGRDERKIEGGSSIEAGSLLAYCYARTDHQSLAEATMNQTLAEMNGSWTRPQTDSPLFCRNQACFYLYAFLLSAETQNQLRQSRYRYEFQRWITQPAVAASPLALALKQQARCIDLRQ